MAKYTCSIRELIFFYGESTVKSWFCDYDLENYLTAEEIAVINDRGTWTKERLADKIVDHFLLREIGLETPALFRLRVRSFMRNLMESKLPLIYSASIAYDPMVNVDFEETYTEEHQDNGTDSHSITNSTSGRSDSTGSNTNTGSSLQINSDTPQGQINKADILAGNYASNTSANESTATGSNTDATVTTGTGSETGNNTRNDNGTREYTRKQKGNSGTLTTAQALIRQYRDNIVAIDADIINNLESLFIGLY